MNMLEGTIGVTIASFVIVAMIAGTIYFLVRTRIDDIHVHPLARTPDLRPSKEENPKETVAETKKAAVIVTKTRWVWVRERIWSKSGKIILGILLVALVILYFSPRARVATLPRSWTEGNNPRVVVVPQGKSVGGTLQWNSEARVTLRPRINRERLDEHGVCFAGIIPPGSWMDVEFVTYHQSRTPWKAVLVDYGYVGKFLTPELMQQHAMARRDVPSGVLDLFGLPTSGKHAARITDRSVSPGETGFKVSEWYLQSSPGGPSEVVIDLKAEPKGTFQYLVEVGVKETVFQIPQGNWKWVWVVPIHHKEYQARFDGEPIDSEGVSTPRKENEMALIAVVNGEESILKSALLIPSTHVSTRVQLFLNTKQKMKPAKIIVGIQM